MDLAATAPRTERSIPAREEDEMTRRLLKLTLLALVATSTWAAAARADGLPVLGVDTSPNGVAALQAPLRYVALGSGVSTVLARIERNGGRVSASVHVRGRFAIPLVAFDGSASGLSADGGTLVLLRPRVTFPQQKTTFAIVDAGRLRLRRIVTLRGDFSFDAISPDGSRLYFIQYLSPRDVNRYRVRAYDVGNGRLLARPVVDPHERGPAMRGYPLTRATSPDGRWAYTLYDGAGTHPFVHALDTATGTAHCVDLDSLAGDRELYELRLRLDGDQLVVRASKRPLAVVDTRTFRVEEPQRESSAAWTATGTAGGAMAVVAVLTLAFRRRRSSR